MYKKILTSLLFCILFLSSVAFASTHESNITLYLGDSLNLKTYFEQHNLEDKLTANTLIQNADSQIMVIDQYHNIKTLSVGKTVLVLSNGQDLTTLYVTVKSPVKTVEISDKELTLYLGEIYPLDYTVIPHDDYHKPVKQTLKWSVSKNNIVGVKGSKKIYTYAVGHTTLIGTTTDGNYSITVDVNVIGNPHSLVIKPDLVNSYVNVGEKRQLRAFFGTKDVSRFIEWEVQYPDILTIDDNGIVSPLKAGTCEIYAKSSISYKKEDYTFFVRSMVDSITLDHSSITFDKPNMTKQLNANLKYKDSNVTPLLDGYYYKSSNPSIATVSDSGLITAKSAGIALISVISNDSSISDNCTVEVLDDKKSTSIDYTLVRDIYLEPYATPILIGQKIPLYYEITPNDATNQSVKFQIVNGDNTQIQFIDGKYYFVPNDSGNTRIKVSAMSDLEDIEDEIEVTVRSPIASLNLGLEINRGTESQQKLYIGETSKVVNNIYTQGHYSTFDVYENTLEYSIDDADILKLEYINGEYYITALKKGTTSIRVENIEERHDESLRIKVTNPVDELLTYREVLMPVDNYYQPTITFIPIHSATKVDNLQVEKGLKLSVEDFYFSESYINDEINYEMQIIENFNSVSQTTNITATIARHNTRLSRLKLLKDSTLDGYCLVKNNFLKDRNFESYRYYDIQDNKILGHYPGMANVKITINGSAVSAHTLITWTNNPREFSIKKNSKWLNLDATIYELDLEDTLMNLTTEDKMKYLLVYLSNQELFDEKPSIKLLKSLSEVNVKELPSSLLQNFKKEITKQELAFIAIYLENLHLNNIKAPTTTRLLYDVINEDVMNAINKNYVIPDSTDYFGVATIANYSEFKDIADRIVPDNTLPLTFEKDFTSEDLLFFISELN